MSRAHIGFGMAAFGLLILFGDPSTARDGIAETSTPVAASTSASASSGVVIIASPAAPRMQSLLVSNRSVLSPTGQVIGYKQEITVINNKPIKPVTAYADDSTPIRSPRAPAPSSGAPPSPSVLACGTEAAVEVIANEITYGAAGPHVPTRADSSVGGGNFVAQFGGADVTVGATTTVDISAGGALILKGKIAYPDFTNPAWSQEIQSDSTTNAMVLVNNDDPSVIMAQKGAQSAFSGQQSIPTILAPYLNGNGKIVLASNEMLVLYELGTMNPASPAFDFQDLVLKVRTGCPVGSEVVLRGSIGANNTTTNGNWPYFSDHTPSSSYYLTPVTVTANENVTLKEWRGIGGQESPAMDFSKLDYMLRMWNTPQAAISNVASGNIANIFFSIPSQGPTSWGQTANQPGVGVKPTWEFKFDISSAGIQILAGESRTIGVSFETGGSANGGDWGWVESSELGASDIIIAPNDLPAPGWMYIADDPDSHFDGRVGVEIRGQTF